MQTEAHQQGAQQGWERCIAALTAMELAGVEGEPAPTSTLACGLCFVQPGTDVNGHTRAGVGARCVVGSCAGHLVAMTVEHQQAKVRELAAERKALQ
jgi:hypothetical protein